MISDYLFLDRFNDYASFVRFEQCFGPLFSPKNKQFKLVEAFKEIVGPKRKYLTFKRMVKAYLNWKSKKSSNYSFNFFMSEVFQKMIKKRGEVIGELVEGQRVFSTKNCRNRKVISKFSVLTDETKNIIKGFIIEYDTVFKAILCKQQKPEDIHLEINFELFHSIEKKSLMTELDRDGITHIAGKYNETTKNIKFLIFKCRSGKTLYIGDEKESETDKIVPFIFGSSKCQLKTMVIELINNQLAYIQPKYQLSIRKNDNLDIDFNILDEKYLENDPPKYEESDLESLSPEELKDDKKILFPLVLDDQFVDKMSLVEIKAGKTFKEVYKSFFEKDEKKPLEKLKKSIRVLLDDIIKKERREEKIKNEEKNLALKNTDFESVFVKVIKMKKKMEEAKNSKVTEEDEDVFAELELSGSLEELTHTGRVLDARKLDQDAAAAFQLLDVGLCHTETVDTGSQNLIGTIDGAVAFFLQHFQHFAVGGVDRDALVFEFEQEDRGQFGVGINFFVGLSEQAHEVAFALLLTFGGKLHGLLEGGVSGIGTGQSVDDVLHGDFEGDVHTALQVQT